MSFLAGLAGGAASGLIGLYGQRQSDQWNRKSAELSWANNAREAEIARAHQQDMYNQSIYHYKRRQEESPVNGSNVSRYSSTLDWTLKKTSG